MTKRIGFVLLLAALVASNASAQSDPSLSSAPATGVTSGSGRGTIYLVDDHDDVFADQRPPVTIQEGSTCCTLEYTTRDAIAITADSLNLDQTTTGTLAIGWMKSADPREGDGSCALTNASYVVLWREWFKDHDSLYTLAVVCGTPGCATPNASRLRATPACSTDDVKRILAACKEDDAPEIFVVSGQKGLADRLKPKWVEHTETVVTKQQVTTGKWEVGR